MARKDRERVAQKLRELLVEARNASGLTQKDLGAKIGRPQSYISNYERGAGGVAISDLLKLAKALGLDATELLERLE
jgi:transcriptional regulator with XRE-family HTH domain